VFKWRPLGLIRVLIWRFRHTNPLVATWFQRSSLASSADGTWARLAGLSLSLCSWGTRTKESRASRYQSDAQFAAEPQRLELLGGWFLVASSSNQRLAFAVTFWILVNLHWIQISNVQFCIANSQVVVMFSCTVAVSLKWLLHCNDSSCHSASIGGLLWVDVDVNKKELWDFVQNLNEWCLWGGNSRDVLVFLEWLLILLRPLICFLWCFSVRPRLHCTIWLCHIRLAFSSHGYWRTKYFEACRYQSDA